MADYQLAWNAVTRVATIQAKGDALPAGSTKIGEFAHDEADDNLGDNPTVGGVENHVFYHHVRDLLYKLGQYDMQSIRIDQDTTYVAVTGISSTPATVTLAAAATQQITNVISPGNATNTAVTYVSSDPTKATVSNTGLVTAVATGSATITITTVDGGFTDTCVVTIS